MIRRMGSGLGAALFVGALCVGCAVDKPPPGAGGGGAGGSATVEPKGLKIVTWNVQNLINETIDDEIQGNLQLEDTDPGYPQHRAAVGAVLADIDADVVVLQEVEHGGVLEDLDERELGGTYPYIGHFNGNDPRGIDVAMMSKIPFEDLVPHRDEWFSQEGTTSPDYKFARDVLEAHLVYNGRRLILLGVHFKAKDDEPGSDDKRLAEAQHTRSIAMDLAAEHDDAAILILGDYNDLPQSPPWLAIRGMDGPLYEPAAELVPEAERYTFIFGGSKELIDHQMMAPLLLGMLTEATILHTAEVEAASDHRPFVSRYDVR